MRTMPTIRWHILSVVAVVVLTALGVVCASVAAALGGYEWAFRARMPAPIAQEFAALEAKGLDDSERGLQIYVAHRPDLPENVVLLGALGLGTLAALVIAVPLARRLSAPIGGRLDELAEAARRVASGSFEVRVAAPAAAGDVLDRLQRDFNDMADALARMEQSQRLESAALAHELRTPVSALRAQVDALVDAVVVYTPEIGMQLQSNVLTLARLIEDLRALSLARIGQLQLDPHEYDLDALLQSTVAAWSAAAGVLVRQAGAAGVSVCVDATRFRQIVHNLLQNAHQHGAAPIELTVSSDDDRVYVQIRDHGPGLAAATPRSSSGDRLGLSVVTRLSRALGMDFAIRDAEGGGALASLGLPISARSAPAG